ncbi:MAG: flagellar hook-basal body complex protein FliE [Bdellovibrionaceae bacterium]|nr:flagellar hook-basal body complex protein FliE [Pseudobdellovibrionaceae bacterium]MBX3033052.1 flagellar hook-basal body complex protein FliE [Pseudobdellovibrionaceae bacterium]
MDGFTVTNASRFLQTGAMTDAKSLRVEQPTTTTVGLGSTSQSGGASFADTLKQAIDQVNGLQKSSDKAMQDLATGRTDNVADVMIAAEKADIALRVMVQVRNKVIDAYNEIMKMQV